MIILNNDYSETCCDEVLQAIKDVKKTANKGYGTDDICEQAKAKIKSITKYQDSDIHFLVGGTQCNAVVISHALKPHEAVLCVESGHINVHETGAIEACCHKVVTIKGINGKVTCFEIEEMIKRHCDEHMVKIKMIYYSNASEIGTIYSREEVIAIYNCAKKYDCYVFIDGARLANALCANDNDVSEHDLCKYSDVFYFGGTKNGALFGEALLIQNSELKKDFRYSMKQRGGLLAKGFLLGIQFNALFTDSLYYNLAKHANGCAQKIQKSFIENGYRMMIKTTTNQIFPIISKKNMLELSKHIEFQIWEEFEDEYIIRIVCSWSCDLEDVNKCTKIIHSLNT